MKKIISVTFFLWIFLLSVACSVPSKKPENGNWYCEELSIAIDFTKMKSTPVCAKCYMDDDTYIELKCYVDYGNGISIQSIDDETLYVIGSFKYKNNTFTITTDEGLVYTFIYQSEDGSKTT